MNIVQEKSPKSPEMKSVATGVAASDEKNKHLSELVGEDLKKALIGTWQLVSYQVELQETGEFIDAMGETPRGRVIFTPDNWVAFNLEGSNRTPAETVDDHLALLNTLVAYIGRYRIEGNQWVTTVETAWAPQWVGTEQRRTVKVDGEFASVITPWRKMPNWGGGKMSRSIIRFRRAS
ncbi:lipocalin-like domain-containing protein [Acetobacter sp. UBA5411]|uniref:lipocalin-like domain-containing protein n=1 Tax=Acetobacter sp. UBA5411 TaxID=1945905 RepID=UPI0025BF263B|nr:lipocalin-like domain-containing protein [Acetobacter sp. UBA5411]